MAPRKKPQWKYVTVPIGSLEPWDENPVTLSEQQAQRLVRSEKELGQILTFAIGPTQDDGKCPLYDGHQRARAWAMVYGAEHEVAALQSSRLLTKEERKKVTLFTRTAKGDLDWDMLSAWDKEELIDLGLDWEFLRGVGRDYGAVTNLLNVAALDDAFSKLDLEEGEEEEGEPNPNLTPEDFFTLQIPCNQKQRAIILEELSRLRDEGGHDTILQALFQVLGLEYVTE